MLGQTYILIIIRNSLLIMCSHRIIQFNHSFCATKIRRNVRNLCFWDCSFSIIIKIFFFKANIIFIGFRRPILFLKLNIIEIKKSLKSKFMNTKNTLLFLLHFPLLLRLSTVSTGLRFWGLLLCHWAIL